MDVNIFAISLQSALILLNCSSFKYSVLFKSSSQYSVSQISLSAMLIFETKSALLCPCVHSRIFAPTLVPLRKSCFDITDSSFSLTKYLYSFTILTAKSMLFSTITLFFISNWNFATRNSLLHCQLSIVHCQLLSSLSFGIDFSPVKFSAPGHSTSELLRTLWMNGCF